jgi:hypothetical protein
LKILFSNLPVEVDLTHGTEQCQNHSQKEEYHQLQISRILKIIYSSGIKVVMVNIDHVTLLLPRLSSTGS